MRRYLITEAHDHKTLHPGDVVVMTETPRTLENLFIREPDMTLHVLQDESGQYVHVAEVTPSN